VRNGGKSGGLTRRKTARELLRESIKRTAVGSFDELSILKEDEKTINGVDRRRDRRRTFFTLHFREIPEDTGRNVHPRELGSQKGGWLLSLLLSGSWGAE